MDKKEGAMTDEKRKPLSKGLKAASWPRRRRRQGRGDLKVAIWIFFGHYILVASESDVRHWQPSVEDHVHPLVPWCFGAARPRFWRLASWNLELY